LSTIQVQGGKLVRSSSISTSADSATLNAVLVDVAFGGNRAPTHINDPLDELDALARSAGYNPVGRISCKRAKPDPALLVGSGKTDEIIALVEETKAQHVIFDPSVSPIQQRNLEQRWKTRVLDRTELILEIFALRAKSHEGKLQVELARLQHLAARLTRGWTHLERQQGGIGVRGGPGETQLELDKRMIGVRIKQLKERLLTLEKQRRTRRTSRNRRGTLSVALVGYTNAGKSTLFNAMTSAQTYAADKLFATLDPLTRKMFIPDLGEVVLSDTVGFVRDLPHALVRAFHATLEEVASADLLIHVVDAAANDREEQVEDVNLVLEEIGAQHIPQIVVFNKIDLFNAASLPPPDDSRPDVSVLPVISAGIERRLGGAIARVGVSARDRVGIDTLRIALKEALSVPNISFEADAAAVLS
jgi:GTPase